MDERPRDVVEAVLAHLAGNQAETEFAALAADDEPLAQPDSGPDLNAKVEKLFDHAYYEDGFLTPGPWTISGWRIRLLTSIIGRTTYPNRGRRD